MSERRGDPQPGSGLDRSAAAQADNRQQELEEIERFYDSRLEYAVLQYGEMINEGNNGVIFKLDLDDIPDDLRSDLGKMGIVGEHETAIKVLKIYNRGAGKKEYEMQQRAYDIVSQKKDDPRYAQVPMPHSFRDLKLSPETRAELMKKNPNLRVSDNIEILAMDLIDGYDLATGMFREVLKRHPKCQWSPDQVDRLTFEQLTQEIQLSLGFVVQTGTTRDESARIHDEMVKAGQNKAKVLDFLRKQDIQIDPRISEQMGNTLDLLRQNGFVIRDAHHRNFMVSGDLLVSPDREAPAPRVFIIDFASALQGEPGLSESEMNERYIKTADTIEGRNYHDPKVPLRDILPLTVPYEERLAQEAEAPVLQLTKDMDSLEKRIDARLAKTPDPALERFESDLEKIMAQGGSGAAEARRLLPRNPLRSFDATLVLMRRVLRRRPELRDQVKEFCIGLEKTVQVNEWRRVLDFLKTIK